MSREKPPFFLKTSVESCIIPLPLISVAHGGRMRPKALRPSPVVEHHPNIRILFTTLNFYGIPCSRKPCQGRFCEVFPMPEDSRSAPAHPEQVSAFSQSRRRENTKKNTGTGDADAHIKM